MKRAGSDHHIMFAVESPAYTATAAVRKVSGLALALGRELELFHCVFARAIARPGLFGSRGAQQDIHWLIEERHHQLESAAYRFRARGLRVRTSVRFDSPLHEGIVRQAVRHRADLLIVLSSPRSSFARTLVSATDYKLIETCPCPVLFMKTTRPYSSPVLLAAVDPQQLHDKPGELDDEILESATMLREALSGQLQVLHVRTPWEDVVRTNSMLRNVPEVEKDDVYSAYHSAIDCKVQTLTRRYNISDEHVHILEGQPAEVLTRFATQQKPDLVIIGAVARSWLGRTLVGHTAEKVLDVLDSDVLVIKPPQFRSPVSRQSRHHVPRSNVVRTHMLW